MTFVKDLENPQFNQVWNQLLIAKKYGIKTILMIGGAGTAYQQLFSNYNVFYPLLKKKYNSILSISDVGGNHPFRMKRIEGGSLVNFIDQGFEDMRPRQTLPKVYIRSGSIYLSSVKSILASHSLVSVR